jgi:hypothetical protein
MVARDRIFHEEEKICSAMFKMVRHAHALLGKNSQQSNRELEAVSNEKQIVLFAGC